MPRKKKPRNPNARKYKTYTVEDMNRAIEEVNNGHSYKSVANRFGINRTTLMNHVKGYKCKQVGRPTVLTRDEEELLVHSLVKLGEWGYGFDRLQLKQCVQDYCRRMDRPNPFRNGMPGDDWCLMFEERWKKEISRRVAQNLPKNRATAGTPDVMEDFFNKLDAIMTKFDLKDKPAKIYNCDETGFQTDAGQQKVLCKRGSKNPTKLVGSVTKASYTVLMCCNAIGDYIPMFINYKGLHLYSTWCNGGPDEARYNCSPSGWMESAQFFDWFVNCFVPHTSKQEGTKLLIYDGHNSHISADLIAAAVENNIEILCLPAHTSHLLQPLDVGVYKPVKQAWRNVLRQYYQETGHKNVDKVIFPTLMKRLTETGCLSRSNAVGGFDGTGIYPLSKEKIMRKADIAAIVSGEDNVPSNTPNPIPSTSNNSRRSSTVSTEPSGSEHISPKTALELSLLSTLKPKKNENSSNNKRSKVRRQFAESLTEKEVHERLKSESQAKKKLMNSKNSKPKNKKRKKAGSTSSESDISVQLESDDESDDFEALEAERNIMEEEQNEEELRENGRYDISGITNIVNNNDQPQNTSSTEANNAENSNPNRSTDQNEVHEGDWIIAQYGNRCYVGQIKEIYEFKVNVQFLRKSSMYFVYPHVEDIMDIPKSDIFQVLETPIIQRGKHYFDLKHFENVKNLS